MKGYTSRQLKIHLSANVVKLAVNKSGEIQKFIKTMSIKSNYL